MRFEKLQIKSTGAPPGTQGMIGDERGFFCETYRRSDFMALGIEEEMVQDNHSRSSYGIVRGMHFQVGRGAAKLVRAAQRTDLRRDRRPSQGVADLRAVGGLQELTEETMHSLYVPAASRTASAWSTRSPM